MSNRSARRQRAGVLAWWLALAAGVLVLHLAGGAVPAPPVGAPSAWSSWMVGREPVVAAFGLVRLLALAAAWYGLVVTLVGVGLRLVNARVLASLVDRLTAVPLRRLVAATVTIGISAGSMGATAVGAVTPLGAPPAPASVSTTTVVASVPTSPGRPPATVTMHRVDKTETAPAGPPPSPAPPGPQSPAPARPGASPGATTWTVQTGQCFWSIAEAELSRAWGRPPTAAEIVPYWHRLIEANRSVLADPHNADLVFPGQVFALPPL